MIFIVFTRFHGRISRQGSICEVASTRNESYDAQKQQVERRDDRRSACVSMFVFASIYRLSTPRYVPSIAFYVERERVSWRLSRREKSTRRYIVDMLHVLPYTFASDLHEFCCVATHFSRNPSFHRWIPICKGKSWPVSLVSFQTKIFPGVRPSLLTSVSERDACVSPEFQ